MRDAKTSENERNDSPNIVISKQIRISRGIQYFEFWDSSSLSSERIIKHATIIDTRKAATAGVGKISDDDLNPKSADSNPIPVSDNACKILVITILA